MTQLTLSDNLMQLVFDAVKQALKPLQAEQGFAPFTLTVTSEGVILSRYDNERTQDALQRARQTLSDTDAIRRYVLVYDAQITVKDTDQDAILLEAGERKADQGWRFAQRYQLPPKAGQPVQTIGDLAFMGTMTSYLTA
jgi:hypothetical protein